MPLKHRVVLTHNGNLAVAVWVQGRPNPTQLSPYQDHAFAALILDLAEIWVDIISIPMMLFLLSQNDCKYQ